MSIFYTKDLTRNNMNTDPNLNLCKLSYKLSRVNGYRFASLTQC